LVIRKISLGVFLSIVVHLFIWFYLEMYKDDELVLKNFFLICMSFLVWVISISGYVVILSEKTKN